jgi:hypothetical protein
VPELRVVRGDGLEKAQGRGRWALAQLGGRVPAVLGRSLGAGFAPGALLPVAAPRERTPH